MNNTTIDSTKAQQVEAASVPPSSPPEPATRTRVDLFGASIDVLRMNEAVDIVRQWVAAPFSRCRYVVTPNVDHTVLLQQNEQLRAAYATADLVLSDGWPVVAASRLLGKPLPERVPGSDLVPALFDSGPVRVFLLGAAPGVGLRAAERIRRDWPEVEVVGVYSPPLGFEGDTEENELILAMIAAASPDLLVVGLGAPKQELWVHRHHDALHAKVALCVGATIDFLAGEKQRAPLWLQRIGLEWLHRMFSDPRRLLRRYLRDAVIFPQLVLREWRER